jgi:hypothetical protein
VIVATEVNVPNRDSAAAYSLQPVRMKATLMDASGDTVWGPYLEWSVPSGDHLGWGQETQSGNLWTVKGRAEIHTITVRVRDNPTVSDSYHLWVFDHSLRLELAGAPLPVKVTVGESHPLRVRASTVYGTPMAGMDVRFDMQRENRPPSCGISTYCFDPRAGTVTPIPGWVGADGWVRTDEVGDAAALFTAAQYLGDEGYRPFSVHLTIDNVSSLRPPVADAVLGVSVLQTAPATEILAVEGQNQSGPAGTTLPTMLGVLVVDRFGNPVQGERVAWTVASGGGSLTYALSLTGGDGKAMAKLMLGPAPGPQSVVASIAAGASVTFTATATQ